ncbi:MAG: hypothetical protein ICV70_05090 [Jiangellaceae bacterium]|nr:hypothetical protein [Jiangellaceae bacterium]
MERRKLSPDDTSLLGLAAVWAELDAPMPPKGRRARRAEQRGSARTLSVSVPVIIGLGTAVLLALVMMLLLVALTR